ncbi:MAG: hypothetical protein MI861_14295 [Pirellulales bacterium]|nr:hypothetical protein [Pirellulales bacterium]
MTADSKSEIHAEQAGDRRSPWWDAPACRVRMVTGSNESWIDLERPFALLGSHPCCDLRVGGSSSIPPLAYFICCLQNCIEVWPTAAIAFPRWGAVGPGTELLVGQSRITLHHPCVHSNNIPMLPFLRDCVIETSMTWPGKTIARNFRRPVTLIGETHPSTLRLHGRGLDCCHFAGVVAQYKLWMVDLSLQQIDPRERVRCLSERGDTMTIGDVSVELLAARMIEPGPEENTEKAEKAADPANVPASASEMRQTSQSETVDKPEQANATSPHPQQQDLIVAPSHRDGHRGPAKPKTKSRRPRRHRGRKNRRGRQTVVESIEQRGETNPDSANAMPTSFAQASPGEQPVRASATTTVGQNPVPTSARPVQQATDSDHPLTIEDDLVEQADNLDESAPAKSASPLSQPSAEPAPTSTTPTEEDLERLRRPAVQAQPMVHSVLVDGDTDTPSSEQNAPADEGSTLASELTDRMVSIEHSRKGGRLWKLVVLSMGFSLAASLWLTLLFKIFRDWF